MSTSILNDARHPFWRDFTDIPFHESIFYLSDSEEDYGIAVEREGSEIRIVTTQSEFLIDGFDDFNRLIYSLRKANERLKEVKNDMMRYWKETSAAELDRKIKAAPNAVNSTIGTLHLAIERLAKGRDQMQDNAFEDSARGFDAVAALLKDAQENVNALRKVAVGSANRKKDGSIN